MLVSKRENIAQGVENVIISLYAKEISVSDIEEHFDTISKVCKLKSKGFVV